MQNPHFCIHIIGSKPQNVTTSEKKTTLYQNQHKPDPIMTWKVTHMFLFNARKTDRFPMATVLLTQVESKGRK